MEVDLLDRLRSDADTTVTGGASERLVAAAEKKLGVRFPLSYRAFLGVFDGGEFRFARIYRITPKGAGFFDLAAQLATAAEDYTPFRNRALFPFGDDYSGNYFCFERAREAEEPPVVLVSRLLPEGQVPKRQARTFTDFIKKGLCRTKRCR